AIAGYQVWCDVTELLGGGKFWDDITEAIDSYAFRFLFVSTLEANRKPGTLRELDLARKAQKRSSLKDFIIPLKIDAFPFASMEKGLQDLNIMRFDQGWSAGLSRLLELLEREDAPRTSAAGAKCVSDWYRRSIDETRKVVHTNDRHISNWFRLELPDELFFHRFRGRSEQLGTVAGACPHPARIHGSYLVSFSASPVCGQDNEDSFDPARQVRIKTAQFISKGSQELDIADQDAANMVTDLVRQAWEAEMSRRSYCSYPMSGQQAWFFRAGALEKNRAYFADLSGKRRWRQLVGNKSKRTPDRGTVPDGYWHYAVSILPQMLPFPRIVLKHHVVFTDDGETPWSSVERMVRARRRVCKNWWNREWRDRMLAFCGHLGGDDSVLRVPVGPDEELVVDLSPMSFVSPWSYFEDNQTGLDESLEIILV
ncbi:MAG: toll/interleukin-1 receptor domain-containing protein, partial [Candidatus Thiodiazotropha endolucinida]